MKSTVAGTQIEPRVMDALPSLTDLFQEMGINHDAWSITTQTVVKFPKGEQIAAHDWGCQHRFALGVPLPCCQSGR